MGFGRALTLFLAINLFGFTKYETVLHNHCAEQNDIQKGKIW